MTTTEGEPTPTQLVELFLAVMGRMGAHLAACSDELGLSPQQARAIHELEQPRSMGELAERLFCDASNVTGIVDRLEAKGLLERCSVPEDRRVKRLVLTDAGRRLGRQHHQRVLTDVPLFTRLSNDDRRLLEKLLSQMVDEG